MKIDEIDEEREKEKEKATCIKIVNNYFTCAPCTWRGCQDALIVILEARFQPSNCTAHIVQILRALFTHLQFFIFLNLFIYQITPIAPNDT
jgi:hypothetical protein